MSRRRTRGGVYVLVVVTSAVTMSIGALAVMAAASNREMQEIELERRQALSLAESGIHLALDVIERDDAWRTRAGGRIIDSLSMERGELEVRASDSDGDLADDGSDAFTLTATASFGRARQRVEAEFAYDVRPIEAIYYPFPIVSDGAGRICAYTYLSPFPVCAGGGGFLEADIATLYSEPDISWIDQPDPSLVEYYASRATPIPLSLSDGGLGEFYNNLELTTSGVSTGVTPDPRHIYVIDGGGGDVEVVRLALTGTLVVVNARSLTWRRPVVARPGPEGLPIIIADCDLVIRSAGPDRIDETWPDDDDTPGGTDFDDPTFDGVQGVIYANGDVRIRQDLEMRGSIIATGFGQIDDNVTIRHEAAYVESPPPGFRVGDSVRHVEGSWRVVVD